MKDLRSTAPSDDSGLAPLPTTMVGRPFGSDQAGRPVGRTKGSFIRATVEYMLECVAQRAADELPPLGQAGVTDRA